MAMRMLCLLFLSGVLCCLSSAQITGVVFVKRSGSSVPQPGAEIALLKKDGKALFKTTSNTGGGFQLSMPPPGDYRILMSFTGFKSHYDNFPVFKQISKIELAPILLEPTNMSAVNANTGNSVR